MRLKHWLLAAGIAVALLFVTGFTAAGLLIWRERSWPVYTMVQERSPDGQLVAETLTLGGERYVSSMSEYYLEPLGRGGQVGKTAGGMRIHALAGAGANRNYLILTGFMFPDTLYRRAGVPVFDPLSAPVSELRLAVNQGLFPQMKRTQDPALIADVVSRLRDPGPLTAATEPYEMYHIDVLSPQAPGVAYLLYVAIAPDGSVHLADRQTPEQWSAAGEALSAWVCGAIGQEGA